MRTKPDLLAKIFPPAMANTIKSAFERMRIAELFIARAMNKYPGRAGVLSQAFGILCPPEILRDKHEKLYEHYCNELLERIAADGDTTFGTKAEALCVLLEASLKSPLQRDHTALIDTLYEEIFGKLPKDTKAEHESYPGAMDEILSQLAFKMSDPKRRLD
jgi:hypothetical protein